MKLGDAFAHAAQIAALFAYAQQPFGHCRGQAVARQRFRHAAAGAQLLQRQVQPFAVGGRQDAFSQLECLQCGRAAFDQQANGAVKARQHEQVAHIAQLGQAPEQVHQRRLDPLRAQRQGSKEQAPAYARAQPLAVGLDQARPPQHGLGRCRQGPHAFKHDGKARHHEKQHEQQDAEAHCDHDQRIHQRAHHLLANVLDPRFVVLVAPQHHRQLATAFGGCHRGHQQRRIHQGLRLHRLR